MSKKRLCIILIIVTSIIASFQLIKYRFSNINNNFPIKQEQTAKVITLNDGNALIFNNNLPEFLRSKSLNLNMNFNILTVLIGMYLGIITFILNLIVGYLLSKVNVKKIEQEYPNDEILYSYTPLLKWFSLCQFFVGGYIGSYLLPFLIFNNITRNRMVTPDNLLLYTIYGITGFLSALLISTYTFVLTNKRLVGIGSLNFMTKRRVWLLSDINAVKISKFGVALFNDKNDKLPHGLRVNKHCYSILKKYINEGEI